MVNSKINKIVNGRLTEFVNWYDTDGNIINASDGGIIYADGAYHWYGMALRALPMGSNGCGGQVTTTGVVMYRSDDLYNWQYEGVILACNDDKDSELCAPLRFERPKIIYNGKTGKYVLWCHYVKFPGDHGEAQGTAEAGVAICNTVNGSYTWLGHNRPIDDNGLVRDCTLYEDDDGSAYFIYDRQIAERNRCQHIVRLSDDYTRPTNTYVRDEVLFWREAAAVMHRDGYYYMITSDLSSWAFNQAKYFRAKNIMGPWEDMGDPCINDTEHTTFRSQSTYIFKLHDKSDQYILMAERHNTSNFLECSYIWLPLRFGNDNTLSIEYLEEWTLDQLT